MPLLERRSASRSSVHVIIIAVYNWKPLASYHLSKNHANLVCSGIPPTHTCLKFLKYLLPWNASLSNSQTSSPTKNRCPDGGNIYFCLSFPAFTVTAGYFLISIFVGLLTEEEARENLNHNATEDDKPEQNYRHAIQLAYKPVYSFARYVLLNHIGEMGGLGASLTRFLIWSSDFPRRASCSLANLRFARRCCGVCACIVATINE